MDFKGRVLCPSLFNLPCSVQRNHCCKNVLYTLEFYTDLESMLELVFSCREPVRTEPTSVSCMLRFNYLYYIYVGVTYVLDSYYT